MTHIRIADRLIGKFPFLDDPSFVVGSIAPDCGKINPDGVSYVPEKDVTHFGRYREGRDYQRLLSLINSDNYRFFLGYYAHILTDDLWITNILLPKKAQYLREFPDFYHFIMTQRANWFTLDKEYILMNPDDHAYGMLYKTERFDNVYLSFQSKDAFTEHIAKVKNHYDDFCVSEDIPKYLTAHELEGFISYAVPIVADKINQCRNIYSD